MQLKPKHKPVRKGLALATASLLGVPVINPANALQPSSEWEVDSSLLLYSETDRVSLAEPLIRARKDMGDDRFLTLKLVLDALTGSSANGAIATSSAQTFTTPSGQGTYTAGANETPLDDSFHDSRVAISGEWEQPMGKASRVIFGLNASNEYDYQSFGVSTTFSWDFNQKNSTLTAGVAYNADTVNPVGGVPVGFTSMPTYPSVKATDGDSKSKDVSDFILGWTQVLGRKDLMQVNYVYGNESGYLTDPYKILTVVDGTTGDPIALPYVYEDRPDSRSRQAIFWRWSHMFSQDVFRMSYRYYTDDWGINSNTVDMHYRYELGNRHYLEPHIRYYSQTAADFYHTSLVDGESYAHASADYRLADLTDTTIGLKYGIDLGKNKEFSIRAEHMVQSANPSQVIGNQSSQDLVPDVTANMLTLNYTLQW